MDIVAFKDDVTKIDSNAKYNLLIFSYACVALSHGDLNFNGKRDSIDEKVLEVVRTHAAACGVVY